MGAGRLELLGAHGQSDLQADGQRPGGDAQFPPTGLGLAACGVVGGGIGVGMGWGNAASGICRGEREGGCQHYVHPRPMLPTPPPGYPLAPARLAPPHPPLARPHAPASAGLSLTRLGDKLGARGALPAKPKEEGWGGRLPTAPGGVVVDPRMEGPTSDPTACVARCEGSRAERCVGVAGMQRQRIRADADVHEAPASDPARAPAAAWDPTPSVLNPIARRDLHWLLLPVEHAFMY